MATKNKIQIIVEYDLQSEHIIKILKKVPNLDSAKEMLQVFGEMHPGEGLPKLATNLKFYYEFIEKDKGKLREELFKMKEKNFKEQQNLAQRKINGECRLQHTWIDSSNGPFLSVFDEFAIYKEILQKEENEIRGLIFEVNKRKAK